jgi:hypothetical protein
MVCLRAADHPLLTPLFIESVSRQVSDQLTNYFGTLADVRVRTRGHWLLDAFPHQPADRPPLSAADFRTHALREKIFLVHLDHADGFYRIAWRQIDGPTQQVGAVLARTTPDRPWVGKAVCMAIRDDFALIADVAPSPSGQTARLAFRGGPEHLPLVTSLLREGAVFLPFWLLRVRDELLRRPIPNTYLYVPPGEDVRQARVVTNLADPFPQRGVIVGCEAIKLNTQSGRLRLRLVDVDTGLPVVDGSVMANDRGFDALQDSDILARPDRLGCVLSPQAFQHLAHVKISHGGSVIRLPIPITGPLCEHVVKLRLDSAAGRKEDFHRELRFLIQDAQGILTTQAAAVREFNELNRNKRYEEALQIVRSARDYAEPRCQNANRSLLTLRDTARDWRDDATESLLQAAGPQVALAAQRQTELRNLSYSLEKAVEKKGAQERADVSIEQGQQAERRGDIDQALEHYDQALAEQPDQPALRRRHEELQKAWAVKNPAHDEARRFIYQQWSQAEITAVERLLPQARRAFETLQANRDDLSARRLSAANSEQLGHLNAIVDQLAQRGTEADQAELEKYVRLTEELASFQTAVADFLEQAASGLPPPAVTETPTPPPPQSDPAPPSAGPKPKSNPQTPLPGLEEEEEQEETPPS